MIREEIVKEWKGLKEKINYLKLTEQEKKILDCLTNNPLVSFLPSMNSPDELTKWEKAIQTFDEQSFEPDNLNNDLVIDYLFLFTALVRAVSDWIKEIRWNKDLHEYIKELKGDNDDLNNNNGSNNDDDPTIQEID